jgi:hypothetical protein
MECSSFSKRGSSGQPGLPTLGGGASKLPGASFRSLRAAASRSKDDSQVGPPRGLPNGSRWRGVRTWTSAFPASGLRPCSVLRWFLYSPSTKKFQESASLDWVTGITFGTFSTACDCVSRQPCPTKDERERDCGLSRCAIRAGPSLYPTAGKALLFTCTLTG